jgi:isopentenyl diphosphate isomerase/L-lactate dehydrogenase-like FMN-dependent dehydrogenase
MDSLTSLVTALAAGAASAVQSTVEQVVKDSYAALKGLIQRKYTHVNLHQLEVNPNSNSRRGVVEEDLKAAGAETDAEVLQKAQELLEAIQRQSPETAAAIGIELRDIEGAALAIRRVIATGAGVKVEQAKLSGDITIEDVQAGHQGGPPPNA